MKHDYIIESNVIDRYVLGKLPPDQVEEFEVHYLDCPECIDQLNVSRRFIHDLKGLAVQETVFPNAVPVPRTHRWRLQDLLPSLWPAIACVCVVLAMGIISLEVR